jgi:hypothetical protein
MSITKPIVLASLIFTSACASTPTGSGARAAADKPLRGGIAEFQVISYDGQTIKGRILLGATIDPLVVDGRLNLYGDVDIDVRTLQACGKKDPVGYIQYDVSPLPPRPDQIVTIRPGYWYGRTVNYWLFHKKVTGLGPECLEAELVVRALDGRDAAKIPIHVVRTDKPTPSPDGGTPAEPKPPASDAGAP